MTHGEDRDGRTSEVWPAYVRYPVIVVLVGIGAVGLVTVLYDAGWLPIAGPFVAVVVAAVIVFVLMWWRSRKLQRLSSSAAEQLQALGPAIAEERRRPVAQRATGASDQSLEQAAVQVESALQRLAWAHEQGATPVLADLVANAGSAWRPEAALTREVERLARTSTKMEALVRRMQAAAARRQR
jgi:hypothetical protein